MVLDGRGVRRYVSIMPSPIAVLSILTVLLIAGLIVLFSHVFTLLGAFDSIQRRLGRIEASQRHKDG